MNKLGSKQYASKNISPKANNRSSQRKSGRDYIHFRVLLLMSLKNLVFKKLRTTLTIVGVVIGIGAIVFLVSLGLGLQKVVTEQVIGSKSVNTIEVTTSKPQSIKLNKDSVSEFRNYSNVTDVSKTYSFASKIGYKNSNTDAIVYGADSTFLDLSGFRLVAGDQVNIENEDSIIVNTAFLDTVGISNPKDIIGTKLTVTILKDKNQAIDFPLTGDFMKELKVSSVIDSGNSNELFTSQTTFSTIGFRDFSQIKVVVNDSNNIAAVRKQIESKAFTTNSPADTLQQINQVFSILNILLAAAGGIGMTIAILGMFNTLTISLLERTKEIGLLVSLGARQRDIKRLFIFEAILLSAMGAVIGIILAWVAGFAVNTFAVNLAYSRGVKESFSVFYLPLWLAIYIMAFAVIIGLVVVAFPAKRASRISPIKALRRE